VPLAKRGSNLTALDQVQRVSGAMPRMRELQRRAAFRAGKRKAAPKGKKGGLQIADELPHYSYAVAPPDVQEACASSAEQSCVCVCACGCARP
jgi:hypothetical protein